MKLPAELQNLRRVCVFGLGRSGVAAVRLLRQLGLEVQAVNEGEVETWYGRDGLSAVLPRESCHAQDQAPEIFASADLIVLSPGIPTTHPVLAQARSRGVRLVSEIELAFWCTRNIPVIAITGTNGKTTTTTMIAESLRLARKRVFCGGNIGVPYCEMASRMLAGESFDFAVIEVSSFQLETIDRFHPRIGLILNLTPNHSERYTGLEDYGRAKLRLIKNMTAQDHLIIGVETGPMVEWVANSPAQKHLFSKAQLDSRFVESFDFSRGVLVGGHNRANFYCAWKVLSLLGIADLSALFQRFIDSFPGVEHRLEFVGEFRGLRVYNDAKSTNGEATRTALAAFEDGRPLYLVVGGKLRNQTDRLLPDLLPFKGRIAKIFTIGETTARLATELGQEFAVEASNDLDGLFQRVKAQGLVGNLVFSPAHPSFDQFKNYVNRGEVFKERARSWLGEKT